MARLVYVVTGEGSDEGGLEVISASTAVVSDPVMKNFYWTTSCRDLEVDIAMRYDGCNVPGGDVAVFDAENDIIVVKNNAVTPDLTPADEEDEGKYYVLSYDAGDQLAIDDRATAVEDGSVRTPQTYDAFEAYGNTMSQETVAAGVGDEAKRTPLILSLIHI